MNSIVPLKWILALLQRDFLLQNEKIETELQNNVEKLSKFENSVEERQNALENSFYEKLQQNDGKISLLSEDTTETDI